MYHTCAHKVSTHITLSKLECRIVYHPFCHIRLGTSEDGLVFDLNADVILATFARLDSAAGPESSSTRLIIVWKNTQWNLEKDANPDGWWPGTLLNLGLAGGAASSSGSATIETGRPRF